MGDEEDYYMSRAFDTDEGEHEEAVRRVKERLRAKSGKGPSRARAQREPQTSIRKVLSDRSRKNSRTKGSRAELDVAQMFSRWCGEHVRRTPQSGGWSNARFGVTADLVCPKKAFPFHVEVKHREGWALDDLVTGVRADHDRSVVKWWEQCWNSCPKTEDGHYYTLHKEPLLVFRRNHQPWLVMYRMDSDHRPRHAPPSLFKLANCEAVCDNVVVMLLSEYLDHTKVPKGLARGRKP